MSEPWVVLKFGGTSVAGRPQWEAIAKLVRQRRAEGYRVLVVVSAVAGVTNALETLATAGEPDATGSLLRQHAVLAAELGVVADDTLSEGQAILQAALARYKMQPHPADLARILSLGEWLSSRIGCQFLQASVETGWVDVREALQVLPEADVQSKRAWLSARCVSFHDPQLAARWADLAPVLITQGFVASAPDGRPALLGRGGSDTSAALLATRLAARQVEIWTDVKGLYSADPRIQPGAQLLKQLDYAEALEMAAGGARVIHGRSIRAAAEGRIPLLIRDLQQPEAEYTRITALGDDAPPGVRAITSQHNMLVLLLENLDTRQQVGFLARVFTLISGLGISVDQVATSETTTTLAINRAANHLDEAVLAALQDQLGAICRVSVFAPCVCINLVGRGARMALPRLQVCESFFSDHPLLMMSQSANDLSISLLVEAADADQLSRLLHEHLLERH